MCGGVAVGWFVYLRCMVWYGFMIRRVSFMRRLKVEVGMPFLWMG